MPKQEPRDEWITSKEAAAILTVRSNHAVSDAYVRLLGSKGKLETKVIDARKKLYKRSDVLKYRVTARASKSDTI